MTPAEVAELIDAAKLPEGYSLEVKPQRQFEARNLWSIRIFKDDMRVWGRATYPSSLPAAIRRAAEIAWEIVVCPECHKKSSKVGPYWLCTNLDCDRLVVA